MSRYSLSHRTTGAGSTTLPISTLLGGTGARVKLKEIQVFNTTATAVTLALRRITALGTAGSAISSPLPWDVADVAAIAAIRDTHTVTPTFVTGELGRLPLGAAIGSGLILSFLEPGILVPATANNGLALIVATGTGQICDVTWVWEEA